MPLPSSGQISVSDINTELGRTSNTANSNFAGGTTPQSGSLFKLGEAGGVNQTAPHKMSEWYGYNAVHLVYQSSIKAVGGGPTYSSSSVWTNTYSSNEGTGCSDALALSASPSDISTNNKSTIIIFTIEDSSGLNYADAFDLYFYRTISSNDDIIVGISTAYFNNFGFLTYSQTRTIASSDTNLSGSTASVSFNAATLGSPNIYLIFHLAGSDATNSASVSFSDINTRENCPV